MKNLIYFIFLFPFSLFGQYQISGQVSSSSGEPLKNCDVMIRERNSNKIIQKIVKTDQDGNYKILLNSKDRILLASKENHYAKGMRISEELIQTINFQLDTLQIDGNNLTRKIAPYIYETSRKVIIRAGKTIDVYNPFTLETTHYAIPPKYIWLKEQVMNKPE